jgi:hypothetical protein
MIEFDRPLKCPYCGCTTLTREDDLEWFATAGVQGIIQVDVRCKCRSCGTSFTIHVEKRAEVTKA